MNMIMQYENDLNQVKRKLNETYKLDEYPLDVTGDYRLLRFFLEHEKNVDSTVNAFKQFLEWRKLNKVDEIRKEVELREFEEIRHFKKIVEYLPVNLMLRNGMGEVVVDSKGRPISVEQSGKCDISKVVNEATLQEMMEMHISHLEKRSLILDQLSRERNELVQVVLIKDFRDADTFYPLRHPSNFKEFLNRVQLMVQVSRDYYPHTVGKAFIYKAPGAFGRIWKFFANNVLKQHHVNLTEFVDGNLTDIFSTQVLPRSLGGVNGAPLSQLPK